MTPPTLLPQLPPATPEQAIAPVTAYQLNCLLESGHISYYGALSLCPSSALKLLQVPAKPDASFAVRAEQILITISKLWDLYRVEHDLPEKPCVCEQGASLLFRAVSNLHQFILIERKGSKTASSHSSWVLVPGQEKND